MNAQIIPFRYQSTNEVRTVVIDGEPWFVLTDLARVLGIVDVSRLSSRLDDEVRQTHPIPDALGRTQFATIVSEAGMYEVVIRSDKPGAVAFRRWITGTVLPEIRKTGTYGVAKALPQTYADALRALADEAEAHELARVRITELEPPARAWLHLVDATGDYAVGDAAKILSRDPSISIGQNTLFRWIGKHGWLYRREGDWHPYQERVAAGLLTSKANRPYWNGRLGVEVVPAPTIRVTAKGLHKLYVALGGLEDVEVQSSHAAS